MNHGENHSQPPDIDVMSLAVNADEIEDVGPGKGRKVMQFFLLWGELFIYMGISCQKVLP